MPQNKTKPRAIKIIFHTDLLPLDWYIHVYSLYPHRYTSMHIYKHAYIQACTYTPL